MDLKTAIERRTKEKLFVSLALRPGTTGTRVYTKIFEKYGIDAEYVACECTDLAGDIELVRQHCAGASITMPYKQQVAKFIDVNYSPFTPVNTVVNTNGFLAGYNCDLLGLKDVLESRVTGKEVNIIGSGAMSKNVQMVCKDRAEFFKVYSRRHGNWLMRNTNYDVVINTTSIGMGNNECPLDDIRADLIVDCVMGETELIRRATAAGKEVITGYDIYNAQLRHQVRLYIGVDIGNSYEYLK